MHRIDHPSADVSTPSRPVFTEGNPALGQAATVVTDDWLNDVQENLMRLCVLAGISPVKGRDQDVYDAVVALVNASGVAGRLSGVVTLSANTTLTNAAHNGRLVNLSNSSTFTITMPLANTVAAGGVIWFYNSGSAPVTITRQGGDTLTTQSGTFYLLFTGDAIAFVSNGTNTWVEVLESYLGNRSRAITDYTGNQTLTNLQFGGVVRYTGTGAATFTLPAANTGPVGSTIQVVNLGTGALTIARAGSDTFSYQNGTATTIATIPPGGNAELQTNGVSNWTLTNGTLALQYGAHLTQTAAQFDNSQLLASTAFVQRALGNYRGFTGLVANASLTAAEAGHLIYASSSTGTITLSLPAASSLPAGSAYHITNTGVDNVIVTRVGGDTIVLNNTTNAVTSITLRAGDSIKLISLGTGSLWYHDGGSGQLARAGVFANSIAASGWQRLPSGLILQWGTTGSIAVDSTVTVTFPLAFPTACLAGFANLEVTIVPGTGGYTGHVTGLSTTTMTIGNDANASPPAAQTARWFAIGH
jgi:hypothetical protein